MTKRIVSIIVLTASLCGCGIMGIKPAESPRPGPDQTATATKVSVVTTKRLAESQDTKVTSIDNVATTAVEAVETAKTPEQVEGITNIAANAFEAIVEADGTTEAVRSYTGPTLENLLTMPTGQYLAYVAERSLTNTMQQQMLLQGIKHGWNWGIKQIAVVAGGGTGGSLLIWGLVSAWLRGRKEKREKDNLNNALTTTVRGIDNLKKAIPDKVEVIKDVLGKAHSSATLNMDAYVKKVRASNSGLA